MSTSLEIEHVKIAGSAIEIAQDRHDSVLRVMSNLISKRSGFLKDISTACLAVLGASITFLTVGPNLIQDRGLFITGASFVAAAYILTFICRRGINDYSEALTTSLHAQRITLITKAKNVIANPDSSAAMDELSNELSAIALEVKFSKFYHYVERYVGHIALTGSVLFVLGIFLKI